METTPLLEVTRLHKQFQMHLLDGRLIEPFKEISFDIWPGQLMLVGGKSGAGKTTILKCIYRTYLSSAGHIWFNSTEFGRLDVASASEKTVLRLREVEIGYCSQFLKVLPRVSALDLAAEPLLRQGAEQPAARKQAGEWLARLGIEESRWQAFPVTFSGGEQQRLNLIRAFITMPRLLLLDEPTASLDPKSKNIVLDLIAEAKEAGTAIVTVSHDMSALQKLADDTYMLKN